MSARPLIELEKSRFASTEQVFFWIGVTAPSEYPIPESLLDTGRVIIIRPDGTQKIDVVGRSADGMPGSGWRGGWGLGSEKLQLGVYIVVFEFAGQRTSPASFVVEDVPILNDIVAEFLFPSPFLLGAADRVTLLIRNQSSQMIRFPHRGEMNESISVELIGERLRSAFFVPHAVLLSAAGINQSSIAQTFTWDLAPTVSTVTLPPGGTYRLEVPLSAVLTTAAETATSIPRGEYEVRLSTVVQVLIGERDGAWGGLGPFRLRVASVAHGVLN